jgi:hypothetical protein
MSNPINEAAELKPCPFCGCAMRIESNRDWHRLKGDHGDECIFDADTEIGTMPATDEDRLTMVEYWNRRATLPPASGEAVGEVILFGGDSDLKEISWAKGKMPAPGTKLYTQPAPEVQASHGAVALSASLLGTGSTMANVLYNFAQKCGKVITKSDAELFDKLRKGWDVGVRATPASADSAADARDAARYRWLRDKSEPGICAFYLSVGKAFDGVKFNQATVDEAIDAQVAAIQAKDGT